MPKTSKAGRTSRPAARGTAGYTYVSLLIAMAAIAMAAQATWIPTETEARRQAETELIFRGLAYKAAIEAYWRFDPLMPAYPSDLNDLLSDPRADGVRHIRRLYASPVGNGWQRIDTPGGGIQGVVPASRDAPLKRTDFPKELEIFEDARDYRDWQFVFTPD